MVLQMLLAKQKEGAVNVGKSRIEANDNRAEKAIEENFDARKRAADARSEDGGFFDGLLTAAEALTVDLVKMETLADPFAAVDRSFEKAGDATIDSRQFWADLEKGALEVAKWGAVAGSVVLAVGSLGSAAPVAALAIVGAVMSCAAAADSTFHVLEACGVSKETAMWIDVGLCVGGALTSGASGVAQLLSSQTNNVSVLLKVAGTAADGISGGAAVVGGGAHLEVAVFEHDAMMADADAANAEMVEARAERGVQKAMSAIAESYQSCERGMRRVSEAMKANSTATTALMMRV